MPARKSNGKSKRKPPARNTTPKPTTPIRGDRITAVCKDITASMSIIDMCRHAAASLYRHDDPESMCEALTMAHDALKTSVGTLELIAQDADRGGVR